MDTIAVVGLGLIGGSLALALRRNNLVGNIVGYDVNPDVTRRAWERGAITYTCATVEEAVEQAQMVVLATPIHTIPDLLKRIAPSLHAAALVTDTASTKSQVLNWASTMLPAGVTFVGGHPMAGRERSGIEAAEAGLFEGRVYCLTPTAQAPAEAIARLSEVITHLGAQPLILDAERHDRLVAGVSHLPFVLSSVLVQALSQEQDWPEMARLAAGGFRDISRLAAGDPAMYRDICLTNKEAILGQLDALMAQLTNMRSLIAANDDALLPYFARAKQARDVLYSSPASS